jgi:NAD(P)-dependent dehydrogenase (short-subunit alcohol dehydrogenase family)
MLQPHERRAVVTGAANGIGRAVVRRLVREVVRMGGPFRAGFFVLDLVVEQLEDIATRQSDEGGVDLHARITHMSAEIGAVEDNPPACPAAQVRLPEWQCAIDAGDAHADVMDASRGERR